MPPVPGGVAPLAARTTDVAARAVAAASPLFPPPLRGENFPGNSPIRCGQEATSACLAILSWDGWATGPPSRRFGGWGGFPFPWTRKQANTETAPVSRLNVGAIKFCVSS